MSCYFIANIKINDEETYRKYLAGARNVFRKFNGKYRVVTETPEVREGKWSYTKVVLIEFPSKKDLDDWYYSDEYQALLKYRLEAAVCDTLVVDQNY